MSDMTLASAMICGPPKYLEGRLILSGYDGVWEAQEELPDDLKPYLTDDIGNKAVQYGGFLQIVNPCIFGLLERHGLFSCFRGIRDEYLECVQAYPPSETYKELRGSLQLMGWDIATGNGWRSASCDGYFPIDPFTGKDIDGNSYLLNKFGLFGDEDDCSEYCRINNEKVSLYSPWYSVAIYVDQSSCRRLMAYLLDNSRAAKPNAVGQ